MKIHISSLLTDKTNFYFYINKKHIRSLLTNKYILSFFVNKKQKDI